MSEERTEPQLDQPTPLLRAMPAVTFGMRAAALAGMAVSAGALAIGLAGAFDDAVPVAYTTCCGPEISSVEVSSVD